MIVRVERVLVDMHEFAGRLDFAGLASLGDRTGSEGEDKQWKCIAIDTLTSSSLIHVQ
jgi:hypothetical protein